MAFALMMLCFTGKNESGSLSASQIQRDTGDVALEKEESRLAETLESIKSFVKENIAAYAKPREYVFVDSLPRTKLKKVDYRKLEQGILTENEE
jgi:acyl-coenzyme A synthetase/AMP-(fatty) acid ligase